MRLDFLGLNIKVIGIYVNMIDSSGQSSPTSFDLQTPKYRGAGPELKPTDMGLAFLLRFYKPLRSDYRSTDQFLV